MVRVDLLRSFVKFYTVYRRVRWMDVASLLAAAKDARAGNGSLGRIARVTVALQRAIALTICNSIRHLGRGAVGRCSGAAAAQPWDQKLTQ